MTYLFIFSNSIGEIAEVRLAIDCDFLYALAYERIYEYCKVKGYKKKDIAIAEINESKSKKWIFFQRIYLNK